jgi:hypothetical protein
MTASSNLQSAFALEVHCEAPARLVAFYENLLGVKFSATTYPFPRYLATLGGLAFIISGSSDKNASTDSAPGTITLVLLSSKAGTIPADPYFIYPQRPLAARFPARYADRVRDPEGNYVALAQPLKFSQVRMPLVSSWKGLATSIWDFAIWTLEKYRIQTGVRWTVAIGAYAYATNHVDIVDRCVNGYTHLMASRQGIFAVNRTSYKQLIRGRFFGLTIKDGDAYCFQACGKFPDLHAPPARANQPKGRVLRIRIERNRITDVTVIVRGLDDGCHQIEFVGDDLFIVDCCNGALLKLSPNSTECKAYYPLGRFSRLIAGETYHMNSVAGHVDGSIWLLLHKCNKAPSEIVVLNKNLEIARRFEVDAGSAHNIVFTNDELEYLVADSFGGRIVSAAGPVVDGLSTMPRGISLDDTTCVFGESFFETRLFRQYVPGRIHFADRQSWKIRSTLDVPAAPTEIKRVDGKDFAVTNFSLADKKRKCETEIVA